MNTKRSMILGCLTLALTVGCGNPSEAEREDPIVGTWELQQTSASGTATTTMVFSADSALALSIKTSQGGLRQIGTWSVQSAELTMTFVKCLSLAADGSEAPATCQKPQSKAQYAVAGNTLTLVTTVEGTDKTATTILSRR